MVGGDIVVRELRIVKVNDHSVANELRKNAITVGIGMFKVSRNPAKLGTWALGSCVAIILFDPFLPAGGLAHALLPSPHRGVVDCPGKYVTSAVGAMIRELRSLGASVKRLKAAIIGGANILDFAKNISVSAKNVATARKVLSIHYGIPVVDEDVGGNVGRNVVFDISEGAVYVWYTRRSLFDSLR